MTCGQNPSPINKKNKNNNVPFAGYLPDYRSIDLNHTAPYLSDLILFSLEVHPRGMVGGCCLGKDHYGRARIAKEYYNPNLKLWVTVGGQGRANGWQEICKDPTKRTRFIESMIRLCSREGIQGIDLDWFSSIRSLQDRRDFLDFLTAASPIWQGQGLSISIPLHVGQILPEGAYKLVDRIHLMVYDSPSVANPKGGNQEYRVEHAKRGLDYILQSGCPVYKIWMGIPFFGSSLDVPGTTLTFHEAVERKGTNEVSLENLGQLFAGFQFDSAGVIRDKLTLVQKLGLGGVFIWELGQDSPSGIFLEAIVKIGTAKMPTDSNDEL